MRWLRWKPTNYLQAWLVALVIGLIVIVVYLGSGQVAFSIWYALSLFVVAGIIGSIRIRRRLTITRRPLSRGYAPGSCAGCWSFITRRRRRCRRCSRQRWPERAPMTSKGSKSSARPLQWPAGAADVLEAAGYLLGTPANIGYMSGALKHFFDGIYYPCLEATQRRPYGLYVHGASDPTGAIRAVESIATGLKWQQVRPPVQVTGQPTREDLEACWELGAILAAELAEASD